MMDLYKLANDSSTWLDFVTKAGFNEPEITFYDYLREMGYKMPSVSVFASMDGVDSDLLLSPWWNSHKTAWLNYYYENRE